MEHEEDDDDDVNSDSDIEEDNESGSLPRRLQSLPRVASAIWNSTAIEEEAAYQKSVQMQIEQLLFCPDPNEDEELQLKVSTGHDSMFSFDAGNGPLWHIC